MTGEIGNGHDARVSQIEISEGRVELRFARLDMYVADEPGRVARWRCSAKLVLEQPEAVVASWHRMSLWVLDSELTVGGASRPWETLVESQTDVSLKIDWSNGATFTVTSAKTATLSITPLQKMEQVAVDD